MLLLWSLGGYLFCVGASGCRCRSLRCSAINKVKGSKWSDWKWKGKEKKRSTRRNEADSPGSRGGQGSCCKGWIVTSFPQRLLSLSLSLSLSLLPPLRQGRQTGEQAGKAGAHSCFVFAGEKKRGFGSIKPLSSGWGNARKRAALAGCGGSSPACCSD
jgi:hypothetical protein